MEPERKMLENGWWTRTRGQTLIPKSGDFDAELEKLDPRYVALHEGDPEAKLIVLVGVEGEHAKRLERLSEARGKTAAGVVAELIRDADRPVA
jgi:hypothetical protein